MARARRGDPVDGVLLLDKDSGMSSNAALQQARRLLQAAKAGHTGTLDPLASGLLPIAFGEATKFAADLLDADKCYEATVRFGIVTRTGDAEGEVLTTLPVALTQTQVEAALARFVGPITQVPPMYSALKRDGRPLYEYARAGLHVERAPRQVTIHRLQLLSFDGTSARLIVECSKGTYVRVLAEDIGAELGCGAHLASLRRTRVGMLTLQGAVTLAQLQTLDLTERRALLQPADALLANLPPLQLDAQQAQRFRRGQRLPLARPTVRGRVKVIGPDARLLGVALVDARGVLAPQRVVTTRAGQEH
ncbi:MAG: tRNA pseudouridine(55) synthase TruB [Sutterellaceae bacterium]|nr:tRNA pseudouridine(55) synthase TruB [Burkholderiaceae bacterium]MDW8430961.1 tRNA pseudouridine(55) synthase TruB [Sutterellaceae bacterium]